MSKDHETTWNTYASSWGAKTSEEKRKLYERSLTSNCVYTDPITQRNGWDDLLDYMADFHRQIPGGHFKTKWFFAHHGRSIALWDMMSGDNEKMGEGVSYGTYDEQGKLTSMTGFFEVPD